jgi:hypothetical protein
VTTSSDKGADLADEVSHGVPCAATIAGARAAVAAIEAMHANDDGSAY